jgi:WD40 repeat protein
MRQYHPLKKLFTAAGVSLSLLFIHTIFDSSFALAATEPKILRGHAKSVSAIAVSSDGRLIASASLDRTVRLWDAATGKLIRVLNRHKDEVYAVDFSPDGKLLASSDYAGEVLIWNVNSGKPIRTLQMKTWSIAVAFSPDSRELAVGGQDRNIIIYDAQTGDAKRTLETRYSVSALAFSPDGRYLAGGSYSIGIWNLQTGQIHKLLQGHEGGIKCVAFSKDSRFVASASSDKTARVWNTETGETIKTFQTLTPLVVKYSPEPQKWKMPVTGVAFSPDGKTLAMATGRAVHLWDIASGNQSRVLEGHAQSVTGVVFAPDNRLLASASLDGTVRLWSIE